MNLRRKTLIITGITFICLIMFLYSISTFIIVEGFTRVEQKDAEKNVQRAVEALSDKLTKMKTLNNDWATWDDTYEFIEDTNEDYIKANLYNEWFEKLNVN